MASVTVDQDDRAVSLRLDRPEKRNALDPEMAEGIREALRAHRDTPLPLVLSSTTPGMFVAGSDIAELAERSVEDNLARGNAGLFQELEDHPWPTVAVVDGPALGGGCELALACDLRVASSRSTWGLPEVRLGLIPGAGGLWRLPRLVGWSAAVDLIMTGRRIDGAAARDIGLAHRLADPDDLDRALGELLDELAKTSISAVRLAKEAMRVDPDHRRLVDALAQAVCISGDDAQERLHAFLDRSKDR